MKHAGSETLVQIAGLLEWLGQQPGLTERTPGSFYRKSQAWLHFHDDPAGIFADVKLGGKTFERFRVSTLAEQRALRGRIAAYLVNG